MKEMVLSAGRRLEISGVLGVGTVGIVAKIWE
jgi:hypothetical protein